MSEPSWVPLGAAPVPPPNAVEWKGLWSAATTYQAGHLITYGGKYYIAAITSTNVVPTP